MELEEEPSSAASTALPTSRHAVVGEGRAGPLSMLSSMFLGKRSPMARCSSGSASAWPGPGSAESRAPKALPIASATDSVVGPPDNSEPGSRADSVVPPGNSCCWPLSVSSISGTMQGTSEAGGGSPTSLISCPITSTLPGATLCAMSEATKGPATPASLAAWLRTLALSVCVAASSTLARWTHLPGSSPWKRFSSWTTASRTRRVVVPALGSSDPDVDSPAAADDGAASSMLCGPNTNAEGASFCKASLNVLPPALASMSEYVALPTLARMSAATTDVRALEPRRSTSWRVSFTSSGSESEGLVVTAAAAAAAGSPEG
mmetsp:Transcript_15154/g.57154  ORF Transcript_15154/g.57154 Transcript_15154/m.57154 type:complete len:319 (-) Transcript_15154:422-1378(-)